MPIYEYRCEKCGEFEHTQRITDPALQRCPKCKRKVRRLISNTSFQLKGSGWYVTDYARAGAGKDSEKKDKEKREAGGDTASTTSSSDGAGKSESTGKSEGAASESPKTESKKSAGSKKADKPARASA
jgi:putative FmdB family regulatory protein